MNLSLNKIPLPKSPTTLIILGTFLAVLALAGWTAVSYFVVEPPSDAVVVPPKQYYSDELREISDTLAEYQTYTFTDEDVQTGRQDPFQGF